MASTWGTSWGTSWATSWEARGAIAPPVVPPQGVGGGARHGPRRRHFVEIDGKYIEVHDEDHAIEILTALHEEAKAKAQTVARAAVSKATAKSAPKPYVPVPVKVIEPMRPDPMITQMLQAKVDAANARIAETYRQAWLREQDEDDIETLIAIGVL